MNKLVFPNNTPAQLSILKEKDGYAAELRVDGYTLNKSSDGFSIPLADYEGQTLNCSIKGQEIYYDGLLLKKYDSIFGRNKIVEITDGKIHLGKIILGEATQGKRKTYKVNVQSDSSWSIVRYANLHQHTENSLLDGIIPISELAGKSEYACAMTDHGNMFGWLDMMKAFEKAGKKAIIGEEFYLQTLNGPRITVQKKRDRDLSKYSKMICTVTDGIGEISETEVYVPKTWKRDEEKTSDFDISELNYEKVNGVKAAFYDGEIDVEGYMFDAVRQQHVNGLNGEHQILLAKNNEGLKTLFKLSSEASNNFYRKPHITWDLLEKNHAGLIATSSCIGSCLGQSIKNYLMAKADHDVKQWIETGGEFFYESDEFKEYAEASELVFNIEGDDDRVDYLLNDFSFTPLESYTYNHRLARQYIDKMLDMFGDDFYLEVQKHFFKQEEAIMDEIVRIQKEEYPQIKIVATCDAHFLNKEDAMLHELWLCGQTKSNIKDPKHMKFMGKGYWVHSSKEMLDQFPEEYLDNTLEIEEKVHYEPLKQEYHLPSYPLPKGYNSDQEYFLHQCREGYKEKFRGTEHYKDPVYLERMKNEIAVISKMGWFSYFLIVQDFIKWAEDVNVKDRLDIYFPHKNKEEIPEQFIKDYPIYVGSGRGSAAGSLVCYCLGITKVDPIKYNLLFERFLSPDRVSMPDIDTDFEDATREDVINYCRYKYGASRVANIITFGTAAAKNSVKTINRVLGNSVAQGDYIAGLISDKPGTKLKDMFLDPKFKQAYETEPETKRVVDLATRIEGLKTQVGLHACGYLISDTKLINYMPETLVEDKKLGVKKWTTQNEGPQCEELGLLKMDFLGLRTLGYVHEAIDLIKKNTGKEIVYNDIPLDDVSVYKWLAEGNTESVFQAESDLFTSVISKSFTDLTNGADIGGDECFERIVAANALVRPGSNAFIDDYAANLMDRSKIHYEIPQLAPILDDTYGIILYQEQTMRICRELAGFSAGQADLIRKAMGKKHKEIMDEYREYFATGSKELGIKGCEANGIPADKAREEWDIMAMASSYSFNKSHAVAYSMHTVRTAWLAMNYPYEYMTALLNSYLGAPDKLSEYIAVAKAKGLTVLPPDLNESQKGFTTNGRTIFVGFAGLKGVAGSSVNIIYERREHGDFTSLKNFLQRMSFYSGFNKTTLKSLIYAGVLDEYEGTRKDKIEQLDAIAGYRTDYAAYIKKLNDGKKHRIIREPELVIEDTGVEFSHYELCVNEKEYAGMFISGDPLEEFKPTIKKHKDAYAAIVTKVERKISRNGNAFYKLDLENFSETASAVVFDDKIGVSKGTPVLIEGKQTRNEYGLSIRASKVTSLLDLTVAEEGFRKNTYILCVQNEDLEELRSKLRALKTKLKNGRNTIKVSYRGKTTVFCKNVDITLPIDRELKDMVDKIEME